MRTTVGRRGFDGERALSLGGFILAGAFWLAMIGATRVLEGARSGWWFVGLMSLVLSLPALIFALYARKRWMLVSWGMGSAAVLALSTLPWHPRKAFLQDLESIAPGMPVAEAQARMARYVENAETPVDAKLDVPVPAFVPKERGSITYRWNVVDPRYNADLGVVDYANGRVVRTVFLPD